MSGSDWPHPCSCGNGSPCMEVKPWCTTITCTKCGMFAIGLTADDAVANWDEQVRRWLDMREEIAQKMGRD